MGELGRGIGLFAYGLFIIGTIDNIVRPKIIGNKANVHPIIILIGVLGGLKLFGFIGLVIGPLILTSVITFIEIYEGHQISNHLSKKTHESKK
jgi:predicted PurR-regulated permease PerM